MKQSVEERFWAKVDKSGPCWIWTGSRNSRGYGRFGVNGRNWHAHRWSFEQYRFVIPAGFFLDHLCRTPSCVRPDHLEAVTPALNVARDTPFRAHCRNGHEYTVTNIRWYRGQRHCRACHRKYLNPTAQPMAERKTCPRGHPYDDENTYITPHGSRNCRICRREVTRKWFEKRRSKANYARTV